MNLFGFTPDFFAYSKEYFRTWFEANRENIKAEFYIPTMVNKLIGDGTASLRVLRSAAQWHGVTYKEDKPALMAAIEKMIADGKYPRDTPHKSIPPASIEKMIAEGKYPRDLWK